MKTTEELHRELRVHLGMVQHHSKEAHILASQLGELYTQEARTLASQQGDPYARERTQEARQSARMMRTLADTAKGVYLRLRALARVETRLAERQPVKQEPPKPKPAPIVPSSDPMAELGFK